VEQGSERLKRLRGTAALQVVAPIKALIKTWKFHVARQSPERRPPADRPAMAHPFPATMTAGGLKGGSGFGL
jgi:hypothetical protein